MGNQLTNYEPREKDIHSMFHEMLQGTQLKTHYRADFVCHDSIIVEIKAIRKLGNIEIAQTLNYLKATGYDPALLISFGGRSLEYHRIQNKLLRNSVHTTSTKIP